MQVQGLNLRDATAPSGSVSINSGASFTSSTVVSLSLSATANTGVTGYYISTDSSIPSASASGWTSVSSTKSYSGSVSYTLSGSDGSKTVNVWYKDAAGSVSSGVSSKITLDTASPTVSVTVNSGASQTSGSTYTATSSTISLSGSASDDTSGVSSVAWSSSAGGSGTASGTTSWTVSSINLSSGSNFITVTATDNAGNKGTATLTVSYTPIKATPIASPTPRTSPAASASPTPTVWTSPTPRITPRMSPVTVPTPRITPTPTPIMIASPTPTPFVYASPMPSPTPKISSVYGFVFDEDKMELKGASVNITGAGGYGTSTVTAADGYYEFTGTAVGKFTLKYKLDRYKTQSQEVAVASEGEEVWADNVYLNEGRLRQENNDDSSERRGREGTGYCADEGKVGSRTSGRVELPQRSN